MLASGKPFLCHLPCVLPNLIHFSRLFLFALNACSTDNLTYLLASHLRLVTNFHAPHPSWAWSAETENVPWRLTQLLSVKNRHGLPPSPEKAPQLMPPHDPIWLPFAPSTEVQLGVFCLFHQARRPQVQLGRLSGSCAVTINLADHRAGRWWWRWVERGRDGDDSQSNGNNNSRVWRAVSMLSTIPSVLYIILFQKNLFAIK